MGAGWKEFPWTSLALAAEAATLPVWAATALDPLCPWAVAATLAGLLLSVAAIWSLQREQDPARAMPSRWRLCAVALRLHRCCLPYVFPPNDRVSLSPTASPSACVDWLLLAKSGVANVVAVSLPGPASLLWEEESSWLLAEQAVSAALLAKRAPSLCAAVGAHPALAQARSWLWDWVPFRAQHTAGGRPLVGPALSCHIAILALVLKYVVALPLCWHWLRGGGGMLRQASPGQEAAAAGPPQLLPTQQLQSPGGAPAGSGLKVPAVAGPRHWRRRRRR